MIDLPERIAKLIENLPYREENIGRSDSCVLIFDDMVLKIEPQSRLTERQNTMLRWLEGKLSVPKLICSETVAGMSCLLMSRIQGEMACDERYMAQPTVAAKALADAVKMLRSVDISDCPITYTIDEMLLDAEKHIREADTSNWQGSFPTPTAQLDWLKAHKYEDDLVFSHGDLCMPNVMLKNGCVSGFIDMAQCGAADKWYDIALCLQSLERNFSGFFGGRKYEGFEQSLFFDALGIEPDHEKIKFQLLLDELLAL